MKKKKEEPNNSDEGFESAPEKVFHCLTPVF